MVVIIIDRKDWLHPYWHFQSLFAAAYTLLAMDRQLCPSGDITAPVSQVSACQEPLAVTET
jgi:hypothetical protein